MNASFKQSPIDRILVSPPVRRLARTRISRSLGFTGASDRRIRRFRNRQIAARVTNRHIAGNAKASTRQFFSGNRTARSTEHADLHADPSSSITTRFILLTEGRSGSTLLADELDRRWTEIRSRREEFSKVQRSSFETFEDLARHTFIEETGETIVGCKIFSSQIADQELAALLQLDNMRIVFLRRRNLLRRFVSEQIAKKTSKWHLNRFRLRDDPLTIEDRTITIDKTVLLNRLMYSRNSFQRFEKAAAGLPYLDVWYEELAADLDGELRRVATFLGAGEPAHESPPRLSKQNPEPLRALISNFDEIREFLYDVGLAEFLTLEEALEDQPPSTPDRIELPVNGDGSDWLTMSQFLLLRALLGPEGSFKPNWEASLSQPEVWTESPTVANLYPAIHQHARLDPRLKADLQDFRLQSLRNSALKIRLLDALRDLSEQFDSIGLDITLLGSTALMVATSDRSTTGFRTLHISGIDLTTRAEQFDQARDALINLGWTTVPEVASSTDPAPGISTFQRDELELRLHHRMLRATTTDAGPTAKLEQDLRNGTLPVPTFGATTSMPGNAELLLSLLIDGRFASPTGSIDWVLGVNQLIIDVGNDLDWNRVNELTESHRLQTPVHAAMTLLEDLTDVRQENRRQ